MNAYFTLAYLRKGDDGTYWSAVLLITGIVELNVGIVVGCMPIIQATILSRFSKAMRISGVRSLISRLSSKTKSYNRGGLKPGESQEWKMNGIPNIKTDILQGVDGKGKFMGSWLSRPRALMGTWASGRNETDRTTRAGTQQTSPNDIVMTTCISSHSRCNSSQEQDTDKVDIITQTQAMRDMV